jgi:hypothetical protein
MHGSDQPRHQLVESFAFGPGGQTWFVVRHLWPDMSSWSGVASRRLAQQMLREGRTGFVLGCRWPSGRWPRPASGWNRLRVTMNGESLEEFRYHDGFRLFRNNRPKFFDRGPGAVELQVWSDGPLPIPKTTFELRGHEVALVEVFPSIRTPIRRHQARIEVLIATIN